MNKKKLIKIRQYIEERYVDGSAPDDRTIKSLIVNGIIAGKKLGNNYYVEVLDDMSEIDGLTGGKYYG